MQVKDCLGRYVSDNYTFYVRGSLPQSISLFVCWNYLVVNESTVAKNSPSNPGDDFKQYIFLVLIKI